MPEVKYPDIYNYLFNTPSPYTDEDLKAYKNLDGYKYLLAGWVSDLSVYNVSSGNFIMKAKVRHSQTVLAQPTQPWVTAEPKGTILAEHCTCMAGLGEFCSHVAALLFTLEAHTKYKQKMSCTSVNDFHHAGRMLNLHPYLKLIFQHQTPRKTGLQKKILYRFAVLNCLKTVSQPSSTTIRC